MVKADKQIIGRVAKLTVIDADIIDLPAKIDTGAFSSSIWASAISEKDGVLSFKLLGPRSHYYSGKTMTSTDYKKVTVENSFGHQERRYSVKLSVLLEGRKVKARFSLANRSLKSYPALIGRRLLKKRFLVDVSYGRPIIKSKWR